MSKPIVHSLFETVTATCQYIVADLDTKKAVIIDPVLDYDLSSGIVSTKSADQLLSLVHDHGYHVTHILETHAHADHITSSQYLKKKLNGPLVCIGEGIQHVQQTFAKKFNLTQKDLVDEQGKPWFDHFWKDKETFSLGKIECKVMETPGHTNDSVSYLIGDAIFVGDSIFQPDVGTARCDFPGGSVEKLYHSIQKLFQLPSETRVFVGHDYPPEEREVSCETTVEKQRTSNKHVKEGVAFESFVEWRKNRDAQLGIPRLLYPAVQVNIRAGHFPYAESNDVRYIKMPVTNTFF